MNNQVIIKEKTNELLSGYCYEGLREAAQNWLSALGTEKEKEASKAYAAMLEDSVCTADHVIDIFEQPFMKEKFGEAKAKEIHDHAVQVKENGGKWRDCPACTKALEILEYKDSL